MRAKKRTMARAVIVRSLPLPESPACFDEILEE
jgi:hypothetical protein